MTRPVGRLHIEVGADARDIGRQLQRDINRALGGVKLDLGGIDRQLDKISDAGANAFRELARDGETQLDRLGREVDATAAEIGSDMEAAGERAEHALGEVGDRGEREFDRVEREAKDAGSSMVSTIRKAAIGIGLAFAAIAAARFFSSATLAAQDLGSAIEDTTQLIKTTGATAGLTAQQVRELSQALSLKIGVDSVQVQQAANVLLTFRNVSGKTFSEAISLAADLSAVLKTDLSSSVLQIGKALNDPVRGVTALTRAGVQFTTQQKEQIKALVESGDLLAAQSIILGELRTQVGGVAEAGADITDKLAVAFLDLKREAGTALLGFLDESGPRLISLIQTLEPVVSAIGGAIAAGLQVALPVIEVFATKFRDSFAALAPAAAPFADALAALFSLLPAIIPALVQISQGLLPPLAAVFVQLATAVAPVVALAAQLAAQIITALLPILPPLGQALMAIATVVAGGLTRILPVLAEVLLAIVEAALPLVPIILELVEAILPLADPILDVVVAVLPLVKALLPLAGVVVTLLAVVVKILEPILALAAALLSLLANKAVVPLVELLAKALAFVLKPLELLVPLLEDVSGWIESLDWGKIGHAIGGAFASAWRAVVDFFTGVVDWFRKAPGRFVEGLKLLPGLLLDALARAFDMALVAVGRGIGLILAVVISLPGLIWSALSQLPALLGSLFTSLWQLLLQTTLAGGNAVIGFVTSLPGRAWAALQALPGLLSRAVAGAFAAARNAAAAGINALIGLITSVPGRISALKDRMLAAGVALIRGFTSGLGRIGGFIGDVAGSIVAGLKNALNAIIGRINSGIAEIDAKLPFGLPRIPQLALGGLTTGEGLAAFHPRELVLPLEDRRAVDLLAAAMTEANASLRAVGVAPDTGPAPSFDVRVFIGEKELTDIVDVQISEHDRSTRRRVRAGVGRAA